MKKLNTLLLILTIFGFSGLGFSQKVKESTESIGDLKGNALTVTILHSDKKDILKEWKSIMKSYNGSVKVKGNSVYTTDARIESISSGNVQINAELGKEKNNKHDFTVIFQSERGAVSSKDDISGYTAASYIVKEFAKNLSVRGAAENHKNEEKKLTVLSKQKSDLEKENQRLAKKIEEYNKGIIEAKETIEKNNKTLVINKDELEKQKKAVSLSEDELRSIK